MTVPRRKQPAITIRSAKAVELLRTLTRDGRSQTQVVEEALERMPKPALSDEELQTRLAKICAIQEAAKREPFRYRDMADFDRQEYDEHGLPR